MKLLLLLGILKRNNGKGNKSKRHKKDAEEHYLEVNFKGEQHDKKSIISANRKIN